MKKFLPLLLSVLLLLIGREGNAAAAATLSFSPAAQSVKVGDTFTVTVKFDTGGETVKTVKASLTFPSSLLAVETDGIITAGTAITSWTERIYSNTAGTIDLTGNTTMAGADKTLAAIKFKTKAVGTANLSFTSTSQILKSADAGNILSLTDSRGGTYSLGLQAVPSPTPEKESSPSGNLPTDVGFTTPTIALGLLAMALITLGTVLIRKPAQNF